jgi:NAD(P)H dehydrogenase (quinone)
MILVTGAGGKTGQHVIRALAARMQNVRALEFNNERTELLKKCGANEVHIGDMLDKSTLAVAFSGIQAVYHIAPNMSVDELRIGQAVITAATEAGVEHFVFHSVLHPQVQDMPHHWLKLRVEEELFKSALKVTILQPAAYMQNLLGYRTAILERGVYSVPFSIDARQSMVDIKDVAEVAAKVLTEPGHISAIYELVSLDAPSPRDIARMLTARLGSPVRAESLDRKIWETQARANRMSDYSVRSLLKMFAYYEQFHFFGNSNVLTWLLGREPGRFTAFLEREFTL